MDASNMTLRQETTVKTFFGMQNLIDPIVVLHLSDMRMIEDLRILGKKRSFLNEFVPDLQT